MRRKAAGWLFLALLWLLASGCQPARTCPEGSLTYVDSPAEMPAAAEPATPPTPALVEIAGTMMEVDRVINGPVCNDTWQGTVYIACDLQLVRWDKNDKPLFFQGCNLVIEPGTTVYVAAHQDTAYYNGCSCHTGTEP